MSPNQLGKFEFASLEKLTLHIIIIISAEFSANLALFLYVESAFLLYSRSLCCVMRPRAEKFGPHFPFLSSFMFFRT